MSAKTKEIRRFLCKRKIRSSTRKRVFLVYSTYKYLTSDYVDLILEFIELKKKKRTYDKLFNDCLFGKNKQGLSMRDIRNERTKINQNYQSILRLLTASNNRERDFRLKVTKAANPRRTNNQPSIHINDGYQSPHQEKTDKFYDEFLRGNPDAKNI